MAVNLQKGQKVDLTKGQAGLARLTVGMGWDTNQFSDSTAFDLDTSAFLLGENNKVLQDADFVFYNNLQHSSGAVVHQGDNLTGAGDGDDEQIKVDLTKIPQTYQRIAFTATIHDAAERKQNFGQVQNAYIRVVNEENGTELVRFDLSEDFSVETSLVFGELYRHNGEWKFNAVGTGLPGGLEALCIGYGISV